MASGLSAQTYYEIDESFSTDGKLNRGSINGMFLEGENTLFIWGPMQNLGVPGGAANRINLDGNWFEVVAPGESIGLVLHKYLAGYITSHLGGGYRYRNQDFEDVSGYYFDYSFDPYDQGWNLANDFLEWPDGDFLGAGRFSVDTLASLPDGLAGLIKINPDGSPDETFEPIFLQPPVGQAWNNKYILTMDTLSNGDLVVAGRFGTINGHTYHHIAKLNQNFDVIESFQNPLSSDGEIVLELIDSQDRIWIYLGYAEAPDMPENQFVLRLLSNGEVDQSFVEPEIITDEEFSAPTQGWPRKIHELPDGTFLFTGGIVEADGLSCKGIVHIADNGDVIDDFWRLTGPDEAVWGGWDKDPWVGNMIMLDDGDIIFDGHFSSWDGHPTSNLAKLNMMTVGVDETNGLQELHIYPNPASDQIQIGGDFHGQVIQSLTIHDIQGRVVIQKQNQPSSKPLNVSSLPSGMFLMRVESESGVGVGKFVVRK